MTRALLTSILFAALAFAAPPARADVPPGPPVSPNDDCTVEKQCKDGKTCPTLGGDVDKDCAADMAKSGLVQKCVQRRGTIGKAVFCPGPGAKKGCAKSSVAPTGTSGEGTTALGLIAAGLVVAGLRRARSRR
jgi:hypothetical protein